jgi:predicted nucleic acid-binding protein
VTVFVDTSALYALLDEDDRQHRLAVSAWPDLLDRQRLVTHAYVVVEVSALVQRRLGMSAAIRLHQALLPPVRVIAIDDATHARSAERWLAAAQRALSLVDVTSFVVMESLGATRAFAFDADFATAGFTTLP